MSVRARCFGFAAAAGVLAAVHLASAQGTAPPPVAQANLYGVVIRVDRGADGALTLDVPGSPPSPLPGRGDARIETVPVGAGTVLVVRTPQAGAIVSATPGGPPHVLFAGPLGSVGDDPGERHTTEIVVRDLDGDGRADVVLAERHEDVRICGAGSPFVRARAVVPQTLQLGRVVLNPMREDLTQTGRLPPAHPLNAVALGPASAAPPPVLSPLSFGARVARGVDTSGAAVLTDHDDATSWQLSVHDFATATVRLAGLRAQRILLVAPPAPAALPTRIALLVGPDPQRWEVTLPTVAPGTRVAIPIVPSRTLDCVSVVALDTPAHAPAAIAEVQVATELDANPDPVGTLVHALAGPQGDDAALLLESMGEPGVRALAERLPTLDVGPARVALRMLSQHHTTEVAAALVALLDRPELAPDARQALQRFGAEALEPLSHALAHTAAVADLILTLRAPLDAKLSAVLPALSAEHPVWHAERGSVRALVEQAAQGREIDHWLALVPDDPRAASRALAIAADVAVDDAERAQIAGRAHRVRANAFDDRFRLLAPLAGDAAGRAAVVQVAQHDSDADLRWEAVHALAMVGDRTDVAAALGDPVPRVRSEAARALRAEASARELLVQHLAHDPWPDVRAAAASSLAGAPENAGVLVQALGDDSVLAVRAAIEALTRTPGVQIAPRLMTFAEDARQNPDLRADAVHAVGERCDRSVETRLSRLVQHQLDPMLPPPEQAVGHAALAALAHIDPAAAHALLASMQANNVAFAALARASENACPAH